MNFFQKIQFKILKGFLVINLFIILLGIYTLTKLNSINDYRKNQLMHLELEFVYASRLVGSLNRIESYLDKLKKQNKKADSDFIIFFLESIPDLINNLKKNSHFDSEIQDNLNQFETKFYKAYKLENTKYKFNLQVNDLIELHEYIHSMKEFALLLEASINQRIKNYHKNTEAEHQNLQTIYFLCLACFFVFGLGYSYFYTKAITKPILNLDQSAKRIASGNFHTLIPIDSDDEIGELSRSFHGVVQTLKREIELSQIRTASLESKVVQKSIQLKEKKIELVRTNREIEDRLKIELSKLREQDFQKIYQARFSSLTELIRNIAHHWRQPLTALGAIIQDIKERIEIENYIVKDLNTSFEKAMFILDKISKDIDKFRSFAQTNQTPVEFYVIKDGISDSLTSLKHRLEQRKVKVTIDQIENYDLLLTNLKDNFLEVIQSILHNSIDAFEEKNTQDPKILIRFYKDTKGNHLEIVDNAGGFQENDIKKIFEPYFTTKKSSIGLGLYMAKILIEKMFFGKIEASNEEQGVQVKISL